MFRQGGDSPAFAQQAIEAVDAALPDSKLVILPGQQNMPMDTNPDLIENIKETSS